MLKLLTRRTIIDCSNEARKYLQSPLHCTDALAQRLARTPGSGNLSSCFRERQLNDVGPNGIGGRVSNAG